MRIVGLPIFRTWNNDLYYIYWNNLFNLFYMIQHIFQEINLSSPLSTVSVKYVEQIIFYFIKANSWDRILRS